MGAWRLAGLLLALAAGVLPLSWPLRLLALAALLLAATWLQRQRAQLLPLLLVMLLCFGWGVRGQPAPAAADPVRLLPAGRNAQPVATTVRVLEPLRPDARGQRCRAVVQLGSGRSEALFPSCPKLQPGWQLRLEGILRRPLPAPHPLLSGAAERLQRRGIWSQLQVQQWQVLAQRSAPLAQLRQRVATRLQAAAGENSGDLLAALVLGAAASPVPMALSQAFRAAGLSHALAASGFHLSVLLAAVLVLARPLPALLRWLLAAGAMAMFLLMAGPQPSVLRAVLMGAFAFAIQESGRRCRPLAVLLLTLLLMLLIRPAWLLDVGFQLSAAATAGLILSAGPLEQRCCAVLPRWAAVALAVPLAASLWTVPLQLLHFGALPLYAVPLNMLAAPLLMPLTLGAMLMALAALLMPVLLPVLAALLRPLAQLLVGVVQACASLPLAQLPLGRLAPLLALLLLLALLPWLVPPMRRWRRGGVVVLVVVVLLQWQQLWADQLLLVHAGSRQWLLARHHGRAALISRRGDGFSCARAAQLAAGTGVRHYDWVLLLDPLPPESPACWHKLSSALVAGQLGQPPLQPGQQLRSPGLVVQALPVRAQALLLQFGRHRWGLLPDPQAWWSWQRQQPDVLRSLDGLWLGFRPNPADQRSLEAWPVARRCVPPAGSSSGWCQV